jgi:molecular chaperone HtpG
MKVEQKAIYYAAGESIDKIEILPQVATVKAKGYEVLYLTDDVDEFALKLLGKYRDKEFKNVTAEALDLLTEDEKEAEKTKNESSEEMLTFMKETIGKVSAVKWNGALAEHAVCLSSEGDLSLEMAKILKKMPGAEMGVPNANVVLEINMNHPIAEKLTELFESDKDKLAKYAKVLFGEACLIGGVTLDDPKEFTSLVSELMI